MDPDNGYDKSVYSIVGCGFKQRSHALSEPSSDLDIAFSHDGIGRMYKYSSDPAIVSLRDVDIYTSIEDVTSISSSATLSM